MFFIGIFGIDQKQKQIKTVTGSLCKNCNGYSGYTLIKYYSFFHIFFIPIFKWNIKYYLICNDCKTVYEIPKEKGIIAEQEDAYEFTYWDLKAVDEGYTENFIEYKCKNCGRHIEAGFTYCPYCGKKLD